MDRVKAETNFQAATGAPSSDATVQGQLTGLMEDFEGKSPPAWAAGAMRNAASKIGLLVVCLLHQWQDRL